ncbi:MAG: 23S rRNA (uracil(1939)-C(5))-methyltransferase RlmD [Deltaproteobacteria bacterium]|nr:23S rRNA (uracil(1939)-C(5))-methyltransferase RlmD [Deltaproteobacteria bacterium]
MREGGDRPRLPCAHFPNCVGCALIGKAYGEQLQLKREAVRAALATFPSLAHCEIPEVVGSPKAFGYRNQVKLVVRRASRGLLLGIYRPGSHQVVDIRECPVHHPLITQTLPLIAKVIEDSGLSIYDERTQTGSLRYVVLRVANWSRTVQIILVSADAVLPQARRLVAALRPIPRVVSIVHNINSEPGNVILGQRFVPLTSETALMEKVGSLKLKTHAGAFLQANISVARKLYEHALAWAAPSPSTVAIDLYCGVGAFSFYLAGVAKTVFGIESSAVAVNDAKENVRLNGFHNLRFQCGETAKLLPELVGRLGSVDLITLNPPRKGADEVTRAAIVAAAPQRIVYVSCDPKTLARDLDWFSGHAYRLTALQPFDMLPQTEHVECVALLVR